MTAFELGPELTPEQHAFLEQRGWIRFTGVLSASEVAQCLDWLAQAEAQLAQASTVLGLPLLRDPQDGGITRLAFASHYAPALSEFLRGQRFEPLRRLMGEGARLAETTRFGVYANRLPAGRGSHLGWHTDGHKDLFRGRWPQRNLQMCLHLSEQRAAQGGVRVLPGTHEQGLAGLLFGKPLFVSKAPDPEEVALVAEAGDITIYDGRTWHRTDPGREGPERRQLWLKYVDEDAAPRTEDSPTPLLARFQGLDG